MLGQILVPLEGSERAEQALPVAARIVRATGGFAAAVPGGHSARRRQRRAYPGTNRDRRGHRGGYEEGRRLPCRSRRAAASHRQCQHDRGVLRLPGSTGNGDRRVPRERPDRAVQPRQNRPGALGSVVHTLVHQSTGTVLVLRQQEASVPIEPMRPFSTLVPLDGSELAEAARTMVNT